jgi:hypothetical protein
MIAKAIVNIVLLVVWLCLVFLLMTTGWIAGLILGGILFVITGMIIVTIDP